jgi:hypothetical protein
LPIVSAPERLSAGLKVTIPASGDVKVAE